MTLITLAGFAAVITGLVLMVGSREPEPDPEPEQPDPEYLAWKAHRDAKRAYKTAKRNLDHYRNL